MSFDAASLRERRAEQLMSDERLLGAAPEAAVRIVLDDALDRLDEAAAAAASEDELEAAFTRIRTAARALLDEAAGHDDPVGYVRARLPVTPQAAIEPSAGSEPDRAAAAKGELPGEEQHEADGGRPDASGRPPGAIPAATETNEQESTATWQEPGAGASLTQSAAEAGAQTGTEHSADGGFPFGAPAVPSATDMSLDVVRDDPPADPLAELRPEHEDTSPWGRVRRFGGRLNPFH